MVVSEGREYNATGEGYRERAFKELPLSNFLNRGAGLMGVYYFLYCTYIY